MTCRSSTISCILKDSYLVWSEDIDQRDDMTLDELDVAIDAIDSNCDTDFELISSIPFMPTTAYSDTPAIKPI